MSWKVLIQTLSRWSCRMFFRTAVLARSVAGRIVNKNRSFLSFGCHLDPGLLQTNAMGHRLLAALPVPLRRTTSSLDFCIFLNARMSRSNLAIATSDHAGLGWKKHWKTRQLGRSNRMEGKDRAIEAPAAIRSTKVRSTKAMSRPGRRHAEKSEK